MDTAILEAVASLSLADQACDPDAFAQALGASFEDYGFAVIADHGVPQPLIDAAERAARAFFALPADDKRAYHMAGAGGQRGYTPFGIETAKGEVNFDLKEFWHVGRELPDDHAYRAAMPANVWPGEIAHFRDTFVALYDAFEATGGHILAAIARYLKLPDDHFVDTVRDGNSVLRLLHYPPVSGDAPNIRAGAHEDINTITLLLGAEEAGLQIRRPDGSWLPIGIGRGALVVNVGDMLQRLTNGRLRSTTHRVMNPPPERRGHSRYSMPFFLHFRPDYLIETLPGMRDATPPAPITAHDYPAERLREIRLT